MNAHEFSLLKKKQQITLLQEQGVYVGKQKQNGRVLVMYQVESFYVEIVYSTYRTFITKLNYSISTHVLNPYLEQIDVQELVRCAG